MKRHRWGVLGTAQITRAFARGLRLADGHELVAVASRDPARGAAFAAELGIPTVHASYEALIESPDLDFVYVPLPNVLHREWTVRALEAGKDVLCEKPLSISTADATLIAGAMSRTGRYAMEAFMYRHHPQWAALREVIDGGRLGEVISVDSWFTFPLDPAEVGPGSFELGGGALFDVGCYCAHLARWLVRAEPSEVSAMQRGERPDRSMLGLMRFPEGQIASFECSIEQDERRGARVSGTEATAVIERPWLPGDTPAMIRIEKDGAVVERVEAAAADCHQRQIEAFAAAVDDHERWPIADAMHNARVLDALHTAARESRVVRLDADR